MAIFRGTNGNDVSDADDVTDFGDIMNGFGGDDTLSGLGGNDNINGDAGNDKLFGGSGNDVLDGGLDEPFTDNDTLDGGDGIDTATYSQVQHGMTVNLNVGQAFDASGSFQNVDTLVSIENATGTNFNDNLFGNGGANGIQGADGNDLMDGLGGADRLSGGSGNDTIKGGGGADTLIGSSGVDKLTGGANADTFQYFSTGDSGVGLGQRDLIGDFQKGLDRIDLHFIDAKTSPGSSGNQDFSFVGVNAFSAEGQVRVFTEGGNTIVQGSSDADLLPEFEIQLTGVVNLAAGDFVL